MRFSKSNEVRMIDCTSLINVHCVFSYGVTLCHKHFYFQLQVFVSQIILRLLSPLERSQLFVFLYSDQAHPNLD